MKLLVQSILFNKEEWTKEEAVKWIIDHGYVVKKIDETKNFFRIRQLNPNKDENTKWMTIKVGKTGIELVMMSNQ